MTPYSKRRRNTPAAAANAWMSLAIRSGEMLWASAEVIARRSYQLGTTTTPDRRQEQEVRRMIDEKVDASADSIMAMSFKSLELWQRMLFQPLALTSSRGAVNSMIGLTNASVDVMTAGLKPFHRRTRSNVKRLRR
jgi:hypothetical protein